MNIEKFYETCDLVQKEFSRLFDENIAREDFLELQKNAIVGRAREIEYFEDKIQGILFGLERAYDEFPSWYENLPSAVFNEIWGMAGMAQWFNEEYRESTSAKIIGNRIYFLKDNRMQLMPQKISDKRREQLIRALLLANPRHRIGESYYEIYMEDGTRVTIFKNELVKNNQDVIIFRRYTIKNYTFGELHARGMIPPEFEAFAKKLIANGSNVAFVGELRSGKTTMLTAWQSMEDPSLEGVMVETDPEIPINKIMPQAPIIQILADGEKMENIVRDLMRSDADYFVFGEARDAVTLGTAVRIAERGGRRVKMTYHITNPFLFPQAVAGELVMKYGGDLKLQTLRVAAAFQYLFHFKTDTDGVKRLKGIYSIEVNQKERTYSITKGYLSKTAELCEERRVEYG